ncbi:MAG: hypothetical protein ACU0AX_02610 [Roseovarius sp.]|uniref:hypothetical protein n=1 Tax=Roseovarius sp. TaxID=1486281 RepID=UPI004058986D
MKFDSKSRLKHLVAIRDEKRGRARDLQDRSIELRERLRRAEAERRAAENDFPGGQADKKIEALDRRIADLRADLSEICERRDRASAETETAANTYARALEFARAQSLPLPYGVSDGAFGAAARLQGVAE